MPALGRTIRLAGIAALAATITGCGGSGGGAEIPPDASQQMRETVFQIETAVDDGDCDLAQLSTTELRREVDELPEDLDPEIADTLNQMVSRVDEQLDEECVETGTSDETTTTTTETTAPPPETTAPPTTTTEETTPEEPTTPEQPPGEGGGPQGPKPGQGQGQGGGPPSTGGVEEDG